MSTAWHGWVLEPHDPLVFGDGGRPPAHSPYLLPPPSTLAGYVRTVCWNDDQQRFSQDVAALLNVQVRGPWLLHMHEGQPEPWVPVPADARIADTGTGPPVLQEHAELHRPSADEGALWDEAPLWRVHVAERAPRVHDPVEVKTRAPASPFWTLRDAVTWSLGEKPAVDTELAKESIIARETRTHVALQPDTGTAKPEALFVSHGTRLSVHFRIALQTDATLPTSDRLEVLGGESRQVRRAPEVRVWPAFPTGRYQGALARLQQQGPEVLLRLQLLTPGSFGGWRPPEVPGLKLVAALVPSPQVLSGWDLKARAPRAVRRIVPAGAIYWYQVDQADLMKLAEHYWDHPLPGLPAQPKDNLASAVADGFGQVLPGFTLAPPRSPTEAS